MFVPVDFSTEIVVIITHYYEMIKIKIFDRALSELALQSSLKKHLREKLKKEDPHYFSILEGVYFLHFFPKTPLNALKWQFLKKYQLLALFGVLEVKMQFLAVLRHLEGFLEKSEESRPPLKLKNNGGLLSAIFL